MSDLSSHTTFMFSSIDTQNIDIGHKFVVNPWDEQVYNLGIVHIVIFLWSVLSMFIGDTATDAWPIRECGWTLFSDTANATPKCVGYNLFWVITWFISGFEMMWWGQAMTGNSAMVDIYMFWMGIFGLWGSLAYAVPIIFWAPLWIPTILDPTTWVMGWPIILSGVITIC